MKYLKYTFIILLIFNIQTKLRGQTSVVIPLEDARLIKNNKPGYEYQANTNYSSSSVIRANAWTHSGYLTYERGLFKPDFSNVPENAVVVSAKITFYSNNNHKNNIITGSSAYKSNACYLKRITSSWDINSVNWNNQPSTTSANQANLEISTFKNQDYINIDVTGLHRMCFCRLKVSRELCFVLQVKLSIP